jgi:hypothetical protein
MIAMPCLMTDAANQFHFEEAGYFKMQWIAQ